MNSLCIIIPCYNEARRFDREVFEKYYHDSRIHFYFVNDGSSDDTSRMLEAIQKDKERVRVVHLEKNVGKAEAVRLGVLKAYKTEQFEYIGFWDADFATPLTEIDKMTEVSRSGFQIIAGSRIKRLGARIERSAFRHYFGRIFSTLVTKLFQLPIYDTQCGAKLFHQSSIPVLFDESFHDKWMFDLELFIRYRNSRGARSLVNDCYEHPLSSWKEVGGSKLRSTDFFKVPFQIVRLFLHYR